VKQPHPEQIKRLLAVRYLGYRLRGLTRGKLFYCPRLLEGNNGILN